MKCPVCGIELVMAERQGVEIDYCPQCRGVWLDRGELDKILDRSEALRPEREFVDRSREYGSHGGSDRYPYKPKKRKSFLGELFDFD